MSAEKKSVYKPKSISGFPEWLPEYRAVEQRWMDHLRRVFESYGYCSIETPAVEELEVLAAKGEVDKEIYVLQRLHADTEDKGEARLALHFDQTVPLARYVAQHFGDLAFPFKRYQMQKVWRGERPQLGRLREFYQCDIDVIGVETLPLAFDAEMPSVMYEALQGLNIGRTQIRISNRKILLGLIEALGIADAITVTRIVDKLEKIGAPAVGGMLRQELSLDENAVDAILHLAQIRGTANALGKIDARNAQMEEGLKELTFVMEQLGGIDAVADLSIVRGLDYYTGTVYETALLDVPEFTGSVCSGGRYDDLAGSYINRHLPGVGISIGFTRLFDVLSHFKRIQPAGKCPTQVLVVLPSEERRKDAAETAKILRARGMNVELYHAPQNVRKQMEYANKKGIPYVWFPPFDDAGRHEVKDMRSGGQADADPKIWTAG
ncbi:MAG: histidine--tRNA ligase [Rhodospirillales bacterium]|nr:histidine--tRNA ligase [Alphaproteobacteria bacterium]MCB9987073.1 histidine--tRNA ligase [Rhodospirillales bacterium]USO08163.1 MAG: histidine--tRNA ligase [Rhodospirillales bacterium]